MPDRPPAYSRDLACIHCAYNLRSLPLSEKCPECGRPAADSLDSLHAAVGEELRGVVRGYRVLAFAGLVPPVLSVLLGIPALFYGNGEPTMLAGILLLIDCAVGPVLASVGAMLATGPLRSPHRAGDTSNPIGAAARWARRLAVWHLVFALTSAFVGFLAINAARSDDFMVVLSVLMGAMYLAWCARNFFLCRHARETLRRGGAIGTGRLFRVMTIWSAAMFWMGGCVGTLGLAVMVLGLSDDGAAIRVLPALLVQIVLVTGSSIVQLSTLAWLLAWPIALSVLLRRLRVMVNSSEVNAEGLLGAPATSDAGHIAG